MLTDKQLVEALMTCIETRRLSQILRSTAKRCARDRHELLNNKDYSGHDYLGSEEIALDSVAEILEKIEKQ